MRKIKIGFSGSDLYIAKEVQRIIEGLDYIYYSLVPTQMRKSGGDARSRRQMASLYGCLDK
jgi:hypothetical protein